MGFSVITRKHKQPRLPRFPYFLLYPVDASTTNLRHCIGYQDSDLACVFLTLNTLCVCGRETDRDRDGRARKEMYPAGGACVRAIPRPHKRLIILFLMNYHVIIIFFMNY
jgi:hypothetical protein